MEDFNMEVSDKKFEPTVVPNDVYETIVDNVRALSLPDKKFVVIDFKIVKGSRQGWEDHKGKIVSGFANPILSSNAKLTKWLEKIGIKYNIGSHITVTDICAQIKGKDARVITETPERPNKPKASFVIDIL